MKYENLIGGSYEGFSSKYGQDINNNRGSSSQMEKNSPSKPPRSDLYRPKMTQDGTSQQEDKYASSYAPQASAGHKQYAFTPTADRTSTSDMTATAQNQSANEGRLWAGI